MDEFWAPRASFRVPIPELAAAADLLALAADSLLAYDEAKARSYLEQANMPALRAYTRSIASQVTREIHRVRDVSGLAAAVPRSERKPRQPPPAKALKVYLRDGFRCRYCGCRIIFPQVESVMSALVPGAVRWGKRDIEINAAFFTLKGVLDHVNPHAHGGTSESENLVSACQPCNYGKGSSFIQQLGLSDPRLRLPHVDEWDGLRRVLSLRPMKLPTMTETGQQLAMVENPTRAVWQPLAPKRSVSIDDFASTFSAPDRQHLYALVQLLESCGDLGVYWTLGRVLLAKIQIGDMTLLPLGIESDATVQVPWWIGPYKQAFRPFAETLAAGLPDATVYETENMWRVRYLGRVPRISELMQNSEAVRDAFNALHRVLIVSCSSTP